MSEAQLEYVNQVIKEFCGDPSRLLDIARSIHARFGTLTEAMIGEIARALDIHRIQVRDMASFYSFLSLQPQGKTVIRLCNGVAERMKGADLVAREFENVLGIPFGATTPDGAFTLAYTSCIGMSDQAPAALISGMPVTNLCPSDVPGIIQFIRKGQAIGKLPQAQVSPNLRLAGEVIFSPLENGMALRACLNQSPEEVIGMINKARLRGRGGAGFPTAIKWDFCRRAPGRAHYVICNADEGEPGTFKDRTILMEKPDMVFEGMTIAGYASGASEGMLYLRAEFEFLHERLQRVLAKRRHLGLLGSGICGRAGFAFDIRIQLGAGAYVCGEESALIESLEGKRGAPRDRPPFPVQQGFSNQPTIVNNVETFCCAARILARGPDWFTQFGTKDSTGTKLLSISGDCQHPGVYEIPYGVTVEKILEMAGGEDAQAVQVGGASGVCLAPMNFGRTISFEDLPTGGSFIVLGPQRDILECMRQFMEFFVEESCGWCAPCRVGASLLLGRYERMMQGKETRKDFKELQNLAMTIKSTSRCGLGQTAVNPFLTSLQNFPDLYESRLRPEEYVPEFDLAGALKEACAITGRSPKPEEHIV